MKRLVALFATLLMLVTGCGIPLDEEPQVIASDNLPQALQPGTSTTTTLPLSLTEDVTIFLVDPGDGEPALVSVTRQVPVTQAGTQLELVILEELLAGPTSEEQLEDNLTSSVVSAGDEPISVLSLRRPVDDQLVVVLSEPPAIEGADRIVAFGQIVFTMTELNTVDRVRFLVRNEDGVDEDIPVATDTEEGAVRRPVGRDDYSTLSPLRAPS